MSAPNAPLPEPAQTDSRGEELTYALTLVGASLTQPKVDSLAASLASRGARVAQGRWLSPAYAYDLPLALPEHFSLARVREVASRALAQVDCALVPLADRRKSLLVADMDSTLVPTETIVEMAALAGVEAEVAALTAQAMRGRLDFVQALLDRVKLLRGLSAGAVAELGQTSLFSPGAETLCATMAAHGARLVLVSGGFELVTAAIAARLGIHRHVANQLVVMDGQLTGGLGLPLIDAEAKAQVLYEEVATLEINVAQTLAVGDGANDLHMVQAAGLGVAYQGKPVLEAAADATIVHSDLRSLLYFQGYSDAEIQQP